MNWKRLAIALVVACATTLGASTAEAGTNVQVPHAVLLATGLG